MKLDKHCLICNNSKVEYGVCDICKITLLNPNDLEFIQKHNGDFSTIKLRKNLGVNQ